MSAPVTTLGSLHAILVTVELMQSGVDSLENPFVQSSSSPLAFYHFTFYLKGKVEVKRGT